MSGAGVRTGDRRRSLQVELDLDVFADEPLEHRH
jgi:hypothetical protein